MSIRDAQRLFTAATLNRHTCKNRLAVAPLARASASDEGEATLPMLENYQRYAEGGFGLIISEGLYTDALCSQIFSNQPGLTSDAQAHSWRPIVRSVHQHGAKLIAQLVHAGGQSQVDLYSRGTVAPSAVPPRGEKVRLYEGGGGAYLVPKPLRDSHIAAIVQGFVNAAVYAQRAGFDGVELQAGNGYLLHQFLSDYFNIRKDQWGGNLQARMTLLLVIIAAIRAKVRADFIVGVRVSQHADGDSGLTWSSERELAVVFGALGQCAIDYIHTSQANDLAPAFFVGKKSFSALSAHYSGLPVIANGGLYSESDAVASLQNGASFVSLGKAALANPDWPNRVIANRPLARFDHSMLLPHATLETENNWREISALVEAVPA